MKFEYESIIDGSISWEGTPFVRQETYNTIESLQDAIVTVQRSTVCTCETIQAKIVNPNSMLLQNLNTGAYFYADKQSIEYISTQPDNGGTVLMFQFESNTTEYNGTLSYLMKGITWKPNYDLFLTDDNDAKLRAYANIKNDQQREYKVEKTQLLGGDLQLATNYPNSNYGSLLDGGGADLQQIQSNGEYKGLYSYSLNDQYTLRSLSSIRLPFIDIVVQYQFYYKALASISTGQYQGVFQRNYDLTPNQFMPAGIISIFDKRVLVGQSNLPDIPNNYTQSINVGHDNDVRYMINTNLTSTSDSRTFETYEINVLIVNFKNKSVNAQLVLQRGIQIILRDTTCNSIAVNGNQMTLPVQLEENEDHQCRFNVTVRWT
ncbi:unnamed protein product [Rotaria sp. Silwood2]|nr:unnamed protein product [Rotaria sp. Silwood2]CAF2911495.1 unnamed protein product [Rotaria sp. Silwood2]CAF3312353.1 unnamed protein product [Rotaria sp. Silwood2]CAF4174300.1 unnamed protein product [Rotaria sp. Silwood2]CAF4600824.1 unnamed protein product [Rotaria sp. Silwood2]